MKTALLAALCLVLAASADALDGVACRAVGGQGLDEAAATSLLRGRGEGVKVAEPDHTPGVEWQTGDGPFRLGMHWTTNCLLYIETAYGNASHSMPYACDASMRYLEARRWTGQAAESVGAPSCRPGGRVDRIAVEGLGDTTTEQLLDKMNGAGTIARLGGREVVLSYSHGLHVFLPGYETIGLDTPLFVHRTGPQWRAYDLRPLGLPRLVALFEHYGRGPGTATVWALP